MKLIRICLMRLLSPYTCFNKLKLDFLSIITYNSIFFNLLSTVRFLKFDEASWVSHSTLRLN